MLGGGSGNAGADMAAAYGVSIFLQYVAENHPTVSLDNINIDQNLVLIETQILENFGEKWYYCLDTTRTFFYNNITYTVYVHVEGMGEAAYGAITVTRGSYSHTYMMCTSPDATSKVMAAYYQSLGDVMADVVYQGLESYFKEFNKITCITEFTEEQFTELFGGLYDYISKAGYGNIAKYIVSVHKAAKLAESMSTRDLLLDPLNTSDIESFYDVIHSWSFTDSQVKDSVVKCALEKVEAKRAELEKYLYNYIYNPGDIDADVNPFTKAWNGIKSVFKCPVEIYVYDAFGNMVGYAKDNYWSYDEDSGIYITVSGDVKTVYIPSGYNYSLKAVGTADGSMDYSVEQLSNGSAVGRANFYDVPLITDSAYTQTIQNGCISTVASQNQLVADDGTIICADEYISADDNGTCTITCKTNEYGTVYGSGTYVKGDDAELIAVPYSGNKFVGWYDVSGNLLSENSDYHISVREDVTVQAYFTSLSKDQIITCKNSYSLVAGGAGVKINDVYGNPSETVSDEIGTMDEMVKIMVARCVSVAATMNCVCYSENKYVVIPDRHSCSVMYANVTENNDMNMIPVMECQLMYED